MRPARRHVPLFVLAAALASCTTFNGVGVPTSSSSPSTSDGDPATGETGNTGSTTPADTTTDPIVTPDAGPTGFAYEPVAAGCVTDVTAGSHTFACEGLSVDVTIPPMKTACAAAGCGLVLELHGDTGSGPLVDAHTRLRERGSARGYIVVVPTGPLIGTVGNPPVSAPGSTWGPGLDAQLLAITQTFKGVFHPDAKRIHVAGFSRGGYTALRFACDHSDLFASVAAGGAGNGGMLLAVRGPEATCFEGTHYPTRPIAMQFLMGRTDKGYANIVSARDNALAHYGLVATDAKDVQAPLPDVSFRRITTPAKPVVEWIDHAYEVDPANADPYGKTAKGHCIPGSTVPATSASYNVACKAPTAVDWGVGVLDFFDANRLP